VLIGFHWADEQTVHLEGTAAETPQDHPAVAAVNPASSTCSTAWYSGSSSLPDPRARPHAICGMSGKSLVLSPKGHAGALGGTFFTSLPYREDTLSILQSNCAVVVARLAPP
jgi:hypothetical protein